MGDVTAFRRRGPGGPGPVGGAHGFGGAQGVGGAQGTAEPVAGEPVTVAALIARAFGVLDAPATAHGPTTPRPATPGVPVRHLHVVRGPSG